MTLKLPEGWEVARLGDLLTLEYGRSLPEGLRKPGDVPVYGSNGVVGFHTSSLIGERGIVVGRKGSAGTVHVSNVPFWPIDTTYFVELRRQWDFDWVVYTLQNSNLSELNEATGVPGLNRENAYRVPAVIPPLEEQKQIATVLRAVDGYINACERVVVQARKVQEAAFGAFLRSGNSDKGACAIEGWNIGKVDGVSSLSAGWEIVRLVDVARLESGHTPSRKVLEYWEGGSINWISLHDTQNLENPEIDNTKLRITEAGLKNSSARLLPKGTVCFSRTATVGKCVIMGQPMATSQDFANFVCSERLHNRYLMYLLRWMQAVWKQLSSGSTHKTIYMPTFESLQIMLPPRSAQEQIAAAMDGFTDSINENLALASALGALKNALAGELLSGRKGTTAYSDKTALRGKARGVQPAFKRAVLAAEVVHQLHKDAKFGSVKHEKIVHICEHHADLHLEIGRHAYKEAAGPYDPKARRSVEANFKSHKWFDVRKAQGGRTEYVPMEKCGKHKEYFDRYFSTQRETIQAIIDLLRPLDSQRCEIIATLYAVWNDYLLDGVSPTDSQIVDGARNNWHASKQAIPEDRWAKALIWMREKHLVPQGTGEKTRVATA